MTASASGFTTTDLIASASNILLKAGYRQISGRFPEWETSSSRLFEDEYCVVGVAVFETCTELLQGWPSVQGNLVDVISRHVGNQESKSWDGYLVLLTPALAPSETEAIEVVRYNTSRLRKLIAIGDDLKLSSDVESVLRPLLPLNPGGVDLTQESALDLLPNLLRAQNIPENVTRTLIDAFRNQAPLLEKLHEQGVRNETSLNRAKWVRGFAERREFDLDASAVVVIGANGNGKTSLFDGILWALAGKVPRMPGDSSLVSIYSGTGHARALLRFQEEMYGDE
jgi:hypothetical protein